jgi:hypothetical protein
MLLQRAAFEYNDPVSLGKIGYSMAMNLESEARGLRLLNETVPGCSDTHLLGRLYSLIIMTINFQ